MNKVLESELFLDIKSGKYYVFPKHIVFRSSDGIYAAPHRREDDKNPVDTFEVDYAHLGLVWDCIVELDSSTIKAVTKTVENLESSFESKKINEGE